MFFSWKILQDPSPFRKLPRKKNVHMFPNYKCYLRAINKLQNFKKVLKLLQWGSLIVASEKGRYLKGCILMPKTISVLIEASEETQN